MERGKRWSILTLVNGKSLGLFVCLFILSFNNSCSTCSTVDYSTCDALQMKRGKATDLSNSDGVIACSDQRCEQGRLHTINLNTVQVLQVNDFLMPI